MGSSSSSHVGNGIVHEHFCSCPGFKDLTITHVVWTSSDLPGYAALQTGRVLAAIITIGLSTQVNGGIKEPTHDYIFVATKCLKCGHTANLIYEFGPAGKESHVGHYRQRNDCHRYFTCNRNLTYEMIEKVYERMPGSGSCYGPTFNCGHWARDMYWELVDAARKVNAIT